MVSIRVSIGKGRIQAWRRGDAAARRTDGNHVEMAGLHAALQLDDAGAIVFSLERLGTEPIARGPALGGAGRVLLVERGAALLGLAVVIVGWGRAGPQLLFLVRHDGRASRRQSCESVS